METPELMQRLNSIYKKMLDKIEGYIQDQTSSRSLSLMCREVGGNLNGLQPEAWGSYRKNIDEFASAVANLKQILNGLDASDDLERVESLNHIHDQIQELQVYINGYYEPEREYGDYYEDISQIIEKFKIKIPEDINEEELLSALSQIKNRIKNSNNFQSKQKSRYIEQINKLINDIETKDFNEPKNRKNILTTAAELCTILGFLLIANNQLQAGHNEVQNYFILPAAQHVEEGCKTRKARIVLKEPESRDKNKSST